MTAIKFLPLAVSASALCLGSVPGVALAQASLTEHGRCVYVVPSGSKCNIDSGECYDPSSAYIGNFRTDCNAAPAVASGVQKGGGVEPLCAGGGGSCASGTCTGASCTENSQCCNADYNLVCNTDGVTEPNVCCHAGAGGVGGGCAGLGDNGCCEFNQGYPPLNCLWSNSKCVWGVGWSAEVQSKAVSGPGMIQQFSNIDSYWYIPAAPTAADVDAWTIWLGLEDATGAYLFQPELWYQGNGFGGDGAPYYWMQAQALAPDGASVTSVDTDGAISAGDYIEGAVWAKAYDGSGVYEYELLMYDQTVNSETSVTIETSAALVTAINAMLEVQGLNKCDGLPGGGAVTFYPASLDQCATGTNGCLAAHEVDVEDVVTYEGGASGNAGGPSTTQPLGPSCDYGGAIVSGDEPQITWSTTGG